MVVTFDTNVLLSSTLWDGSVAQKLLIDLIRASRTIYSSPDILAEYTGILKRDFDYSEEEIAKIMEKVLSFVTIVIPLEEFKVVKYDPDDDKVIACAVESKSEYIITYDQHLLHLKEYQGIRIIKPEEARAIF